VGWLVKYLTELKETTVLVVSHDADFMEKVATDIVYLNVWLIYCILYVCPALLRLSTNRLKDLHT
jgi:ABC-type Mn2+/Zn2+ transport system ATPase subunit